MSNAKHFRGLGLVVALSVVSLSAAGATPRLVEAVKAGNKDAIRALAKQRAEVNAAEADGTTALHWAVRGGDLDTVQLLIRSGANVKAANRYGVTAVSLAATNGDAAALQALLKAGADANAAAAEGETPIMLAARSGNPEAIKVLAGFGADVNAKENWLGESALMWAAAENHGGAVKALAELGADLNVRSSNTDFPQQKFTTSGMVATYLNRGGWTALMYAARQDSKDGIRALAAAGADLNLRDPDGTNALSFAILNAHYDLAAVLLEAGADPNVVDESGIGALYQAVDMHTLGNMFSRPMPKQTDKLTPVDLVKILLEHGANPDLQNTKAGLPRHHGGADNANGAGTTPLMRATGSGDLPIVQALLDHKASVRLTKPDGTNALMLALGGGGGGRGGNGNGMGGFGGGAGGAVTDPFVVTATKLFLEHGVDVNAANGAGQTALHLAAGRGTDAVVRILADAGAKLDTKDNQGFTPIENAMGLGGNAAGRRGGAPAAVGGGAGRGGAPAAPVVRPATVALLRELMTAKGLPIPQPPAAAPAPQ